MKNEKEKFVLIIFDPSQKRKLVGIIIKKGENHQKKNVGIFNLNLLIQFLSPQSEPDQDEDGMSLPTRSDEEFRPFVRKLPEYKFWLSSCKSFFVGMFLTTSRAFDVPVYWPILLFYFILLTTLTMKKRIEHMIRHRYVPISGKKPKTVARVPEKEFEKKLAL